MIITLTIVFWIAGAFLLGCLLIPKNDIPHKELDRYGESQQ